jgi:hypothetical protein
MIKERVAIIGLEDGPEGSPGPSVVGALHALRIATIGVALSPQEAGLWRSPRPDRAVVLQPGASPRDLTQRLVAAKATMALPGSFVGALLLAEAAPWLDGSPIVSCITNPSALLQHVQQGLHDPYAWGDRGPLARGLNVSSGAHAESAALAQYWPQVLMSDLGLTQRCHSALSVRRATERMFKAGATRVTLAETALGSLKEVALVRVQGRVVAAMAMQVLADDDRERVWCAVSIEEDALTKQALYAANALAFDGPLTFRFRQFGNLALLLEIRPTFPHWIEASTAAGAGLVERLLEGVRGTASKKPLRPRAGVLFSASAEDAVVDPDSLRKACSVENQS